MNIESGHLRSKYIDAYLIIKVLFLHSFTCLFKSQLISDVNTALIIKLTFVYFATAGQELLIKGVHTQQLSEGKKIN